MDVNDDRSVKTSDKLTYKNVLQRRVDYALSCLGSLMLEDAVISLRNACYFNQVGLPFKTEIDKNLKKLEFEKAVKIGVIKRLHPGHWEHAGKRIQYEYALEEEFYTSELQFLIGMLSSHNALLEPKDFVETGSTE